MLEAGSIGLGYHPREDRLVLLLKGREGERQLLLTRRICLGLVESLEGALERSAGAGQALSDDVREAVVFIEHQRSIFEPIDEPGPGGSPQQRARIDLEAARLVTSIRIKTSQQEFGLQFLAGDEAIGVFRLGRRDLHRFLGSLKTQAEKAQWDSPLSHGWLALTDGDVSED